MKEQIQQTKVGAVKRRLTNELISTQGKLQKVQEEKALLEQQQLKEVKKLKVCVVIPVIDTLGFSVIICRMHSYRIALFISISFRYLYAVIPQSHT